MLKTWLLSCWRSSRFIDALATLLLCVGVCIALICGAYRLQRAAFFDIVAVEVTGLRGELDLRHQDAVQLTNTVLPMLQGNYMTVDLKVVQQAFVERPWVRHVVVRKVWPNRLWVLIEEHQAVALLNDDLLVNAQGEAFAVSQTDRNIQLPAFLGQTKDSNLLLARHEALKLWLKPLGLQPVALALSDRRAWTARLSNATMLEMGRDELDVSTEQRVRTWVQYEKKRSVGNDLRGVKRVDVRYSNGFSLVYGEANS